jgi:peptidoglycan hydrolase-like protein with peptidoglycan-binding domain
VTEASPTAPAHTARRRLGLSGRRLAVGLALLVAASAAVVAVVLAVGDRGASSGTSTETRPGTSLATVTQQSLSAQTQVDGTLGYTGSATVVLPAGTPPANVRQAEQQAATAQASLRAAEAALAADRRALEQAQAVLKADRQSLTNACRGENAAESGGSTGSQGSDTGGQGGDGASSCSTAAATLASDEQAVTSAQAKVTADEGSVGSAQASSSGAQENLASASSSVVFYETGATYTAVPSVGDVIRRGRALFAIDDQPVLLLYGSQTAWRVFRSGMSPGPDVAALNANLEALGYGKGLSGQSFTAETAAAIRALQRAHGLPETGELLLGSVVFKPGPVRVKTVTPRVGQAVQAGPVLGVTSTRHQVIVQLDASQQGEVHAGDRVTITLPDTRTTPGVVKEVGTVASGGGEDSAPTVEVDVRLANDAAAGRLDGAPVQVAITTGTAKNVLAVPVTALLALAGGGYAIEVVDAVGAHRLVPVELGLFDDAGGLVEITGTGVKAGQRVVVPGS